LAADEGYEESAHLYDLFDDKENLEFFLKYAAEAGEVLDIGAGTGRIAIPLARAGVNMTCVEPSPAMRHEFELKLREEPDLEARITVVEGTCSGFDLGRTFPLVLLSGCFDHFLNDDERLASVGNIARHLIEGGRLIMDSFLGLMGDTPLKPAGEVARDDLVYKRLVAGKVLGDGTRETRLVFETYRDDVLVDRIEVRSLVGVTTRERIHELLAKSGFRVAGEYGDYGCAPYEGQDLLIVEAVRS
jgi:SAM-dependent methyltransferase